MAGNVDKITQIQDSILEAMRVYYEEQAANLKHDFTVDATIVDVSEKADGVYTVQSDGARFKAYATAGSYYTNEAVLVSIPNGDYNNQKFILGRKTDGDTINTTFSFKLPFDDFIGLQEVNEENIYGGMYWANKPAEDEQLIYEYVTSEGSLMGCTKLGVQMDVTTLLGRYNPSRGNYGIRIVIKGTRGTTEAYRSEDFTQEAYFTNYDMYGNTYAFEVPYTQQKIIDISEFLTVKEIRLYFFQDYSFADHANKIIPYADQPANIELENIKLLFGVTADEMNTEKTFLWTFDELNYDEAEEEKTIHFAWVHKESNGSFTAVKDLEGLEKQKEKTGYEKTAIHWYRFNYGTVITDSTSPEKYGGVNWEWLSDYDNQFSIKIKPDSNLSREKYKVAVAHDGIYTVSDALIFQNSEDVEGFTANDEIIFKCLRAVKDTMGNVTLVEDDAIDTFYVYDENNRVLKNDDLEAFSNIDYYLQLYVRNNDIGQYVPLNVIEDGANTGTSIAWAFPQSYTMFNTFEQISADDPTFAAYNPESNEFKNLQKITLKFKIKSVLNVRYIDNTISAIVTRGDREYYVHKEFQFGRAGSFGHEVTPIIKIVNPADGYYIPIKTGYFELKCELYARDGTIFEANKATYTWKLIGGAQITEDMVGNGEMIIEGNTVKGVLQNNIPPVFEVTVRNAADYPITIRKGFLIGNNAEYMQEHIILVPDRVEFKSDGATPIYYSNNFEVQEISEDASKNLMKYPEWKISNQFILQLKKTVVAERTFDYPDGSTATRPARNEYAIRFPSTATPQWSEGLTTDIYFTYLYYNDGDKYVAQSIAFDKNEYPSSLINSWNGTDLTLDEENSAVMARMIAAGTKDTNNRFTGVAMGDWSDKGDESLEQAGIYGFINGEQSFAFKKDGTGFIGSAGQGRIEFDGNQALISNASKTCYINLNPVTINAATTANDLMTSSNRSFSQNFLYAEVPRTEGIMNSLLPEDTGFWARKYFNDDNKDYFVVDPNNGIMTSGGIVAKYGNIGNWYIGQQGLYQKHTQNLEDGESPKYMFLGYNGMSSQAYEDEKQNIEDWYTNAVANANAEYSEVMYAYDPKHYLSLGEGAKLLANFLLGMIVHTQTEYKNYYYSFYPETTDAEWETECSRYLNEYYNDNSGSIFNKLESHPHYDENGNVTNNYYTGYGFTARCIMNNTSTFTVGDITRSYHNYSMNHVDSTHFTMTTYYNQTISSAVAAYGQWEKWTGEYTIDAFTKVANAAMEAYNVSQAAYDQQIEEQEQAPIILQNTLDALATERTKRLAEIWKTGDSERFCIFAGENEYYDPYFSVTWDGTMTARRGKIGKSSPWEIDDDGLTQENNFGRIYLGNPAKNPHNPWWFDNTTRVDLIQQNSTGTAYETDDEGRYVGFAISAGDKTSDLKATPSEMAMKFGVRLDGFLYSTRGLIGGWSITDTDLISANAGIRMNSANSWIVLGKGSNDSLDNYSIILDGAHGVISIKNQGTESTSGEIQLAGYIFQALSSGTFSYPYALGTTENTRSYSGSDFTGATYDNTNSWDGGSSGSISGTSMLIDPPDGGYLTGSGTTNATLTSSNLLGIVGRNKKTTTSAEEIFGIGIATGYTNDKKAVVVYPTGTDAGYSSLGTSNALWNVYANIVDCAGLNTAGYLSARTIYMNNELVATQDYVYNLLVDVWNAIKSASGGVSGNATSIGKLGAKLADMAITGVNITLYGANSGFTKFEFVNKRGEAVAGGDVSTYATNGLHRHTWMEPKIVGTELQASISIVNDGSTVGRVDLKHSHTGSASFNEDGTVTITLDSSFKYATSSTITSGSVTATAWYKARAFKETTVSIGDYSNKAYVVTVTTKAIDGTILYSGAHRVDATAAYNAGYSQGESDAECTKTHAYKQSDGSYKIGSNYYVLKE